MSAKREPLAPPADENEARARMIATPIPEAIVAVLRRLDGAGFHGVVVGGAVRDALLGQPGEDWDVASNATPDEVIELFPRTVPTGIDHGTVTVLSGRGEDRHAVELTTFRGEGDYHDGRRPSEVRFLRDLEEDLARRDLTINAFAWDPVNEVFTDAFGGLEDLRRGLIRAVGDPATRFAEDGLRTMRAVRFAATMGFRLAPETEAAIGGALEVFDKVSRERVRVELLKLLAAARPSLGLKPMADTGLWDRVLAPLADEVRAEAVAAVDRLPGDPVLRLTRLLWPLRADLDAVEAVVEALRPSRDERATVLRLCAPVVDELAAACELPPEDPSRAEALRRCVARLERAYLDGALALLELDAETRAQVRAAIEGAPLRGKELAIKGRDLIAGDIAKPGKQLGELLDALLDWALEDPARNQAERLLERARELVAAEP